MPSPVRLFILKSTVPGSALGTNWYISATGSGTYTGSGTPWTAANTTPIALGMNQKTGAPYTPAPGMPDSQPMQTRWYDVPEVTETIPLQLYGSTRDNAMLLLTKLQQLCMAHTPVYPLILIQATSAGTNERDSFIRAARLVESPSFINEEDGSFLVRAQLQITRTPWFAGYTLTSVISGSSIGNNGAGSTANTLAFNTTLSESPYAALGLPLKLRMPTSTSSASSIATGGTGWVRWLVATVQNAAGTTKSTAINTTSTTGVTVSSTTRARANHAGTRVRVLARVTSPSAALDVRASVYMGTGGDQIYISPWVTNTGSTQDLFDLGGFDIAETARQWGTTSYTIEIQARSNSGVAATGTLDYIEVLEYYTFGQWDVAKPSSSNNVYSIANVHNTTVGDSSGTWFGMIHLTPPPLTAVHTSGNDTPIYTGMWSGEAPLYIPGAKLWVAWGTRTGSLTAGPAESSVMAHAKTETTNITVESVGLYPSLWPSGAS